MAPFSFYDTGDFDQSLLAWMAVSAESYEVIIVFIRYSVLDLLQSFIVRLVQIPTEHWLTQCYTGFNKIIFKYTVKFIILNYIQFELFSIISTGVTIPIEYVDNLIKTTNLNLTLTLKKCIKFNSNLVYY